MVARYAFGLVLGVLLATASGEVPFAMAAGARLGAHATSGVHPGLRPGPGAHFGAGRHFPVVRPGGINPGVGRSFAVPIPRLSVPLPHHVIVVGAGPLFWPQVYYYELFGYLFRHAENDGGISTPFWTYGYDDLIGGLFWPYFGFSVQILEQRAEASARLCVERAENVVAFPLAQIKQEVQPTAEQQAKLELAKAAATMAANAFKSACSAEMPLTPVSRLDSLAKRLGALAEVMNTLRAPLQSFYDSLGDTQKAKFDAMGRAANRAAQGARDQETGVNAPLAQLCSEQSSRAVEVRTDEIEKALHPDEIQSHALESLHDAWNRAAELVKGSCPSEAPVTMPGRMEAVRKRLEALLDATKIVRPALVTFYGLLNDEQKARFNLMAPPPAKASDARTPRVPRGHRPVGRAIV
jgi:LTXXQ motif family protein